MATAALISANLTRLPLGARSHSEFSFLDFRGFTPNKDMLKKLLMTLPHSARNWLFFQGTPVELVPNHNCVSRSLSSEKFNEIQRNKSLDRPFFYRSKVVFTTQK